MSLRVESTASIGSNPERLINQFETMMAAALFNAVMRRQLIMLTCLSEAGRKKLVLSDEGGRMRNPFPRSV
jgi:hypothetical protein